MNFWGSPTRIWRSPTKILGLQQESGGLQRKYGGLHRNHGVFNENLGVSNETSMGVSNSTPMLIICSQGKIFFKFRILSKMSGKIFKFVFEEICKRYLSKIGLIKILRKIFIESLQTQRPRQDINNKNVLGKKFKQRIFTQSNFPPRNWDVLSAIVNYKTFCRLCQVCLN